MAESSSPKATPKRKRDDLINEQRFSVSPSKPSLNKAIFSFQAPSLDLVTNSENAFFEDGNSSPRSKVAQKFKDLAIESGGGVISEGSANTNAGPGPGSGSRHERGIQGPRFSPELAIFDFDAGRSSPAAADMQIDDDDDSSMRKRIKVPDVGTQQDIGPGPNGESGANVAEPLQLDQNGHPGPQTAVDPAIIRTAKSGGTGRLQKSYPSINRLSDSKSRSRKRAGTPPVSSKRKTTGTVEEGELEIIDPIRASLTWHEDEITVYDPEDKDDDGTGINGIGFKPTPAIAYARAQKRRQQLAEYKKREESEAREKRNQRRRELGGTAGLERKHSIVRVRFSEADPNTMVTT
ncbi:hypothetical protein F5B20DRAFT_474373 [Whalleya microplaca]|nr:hypothetical protein F5B20DRAFT_474373 [Whalleya microplaca]